jgi:hypothetical protein
MPHLALVTTDGDALGAVELDDTDPPDGTLIEYDDGMLRVVGRVDDEEPNPERFALLVFRPSDAGHRRAQLRWGRPRRCVLAALAMSGTEKSGATPSRIACGGERWTVKTLRDKPILRPARTTTVSYLVTRP